MGVVACCVSILLRACLQESRSLVCEVPRDRHDDSLFGVQVSHYPAVAAALGKQLTELLRAEILVTTQECA